jgi:hypothetical protein
MVSSDQSFAEVVTTAPMALLLPAQQRKTALVSTSPAGTVTSKR